MFNHDDDGEFKVLSSSLNKSKTGSGTPEFGIEGENIPMVFNRIK